MKEKLCICQITVKLHVMDMWMECGQHLLDGIGKVMNKLYVALDWFLTITLEPCNGLEFDKMSTRTDQNFRWSRNLKLSTN